MAEVAGTRRAWVAPETAGCKLGRPRRTGKMPSAPDFRGRSQEARARPEAVVQWSCATVRFWQEGVTVCRPRTAKEKKPWGNPELLTQCSLDLAALPPHDRCQVPCASVPAGNYCCRWLPAPDARDAFDAFEGFGGFECSWTVSWASLAFASCSIQQRDASLHSRSRHCRCLWLPWWSSSTAMHCRSGHYRCRFQQLVRSLTRRLISARRNDSFPS